MIRLINPANGLELREVDGELVDGEGSRYPIIGGVPRVCTSENYTDNFGLQWNIFAATQLDRSNANVDLSSTRFFAETGWSRDSLDGERLLEVGSGAGRFTRVVLEETKAELWSVDYSIAVEANLRNNADVAGDRLKLFQASIYELPFPDDSFDKVFCLGVLQHTPNFEASVRALVAKTKPGGGIVVDFYPVRGWWTKINAKYMLRPLTRRMPHDQLLKLIERNIDWLMAAHRGLTRVGLGVLTRFVPIADLRYVLPRQLDAKEAREWAVLDTFDMYSPAYDNPQCVDDVAAMFRRAGARVTFAGDVDVAGARAAVVRAIKN